MLKTKHRAVNPPSLPLHGCSQPYQLVFGRLHVQQQLPHHTSMCSILPCTPLPCSRARAGDAAVGASLHHPDGYPRSDGDEASFAARRGAGSEPGEGGCWEGGHGRGPGPGFLLECCAHTRLISPGRVCAAGSQLPRRGGQAASTHGSPPAPALPPGGL